MELKLIVVSGKANKGAVSLTPPIVIGRSRGAELTVAHPMISRRHCEIYEVEGVLMIRDLGSLNGTVVEGQRIEESPLCPGNEFSLGPLTFRAEYEYEGDLASLPAPKIVDADPRPPQDGSDQQAPAAQTVDETPYSPQDLPQVDDPSGGQLSSFRAWDQTSTNAVSKPEEQEGVVEIDEFAEIVEEEDEKEPEPTPPAPARPRKQSAGDAAESPPAGGGDDLEGFLNGLP